MEESKGEKCEMEGIKLWLYIKKAITREIMSYYQVSIKTQDF